MSPIVVDQKFIQSIADLGVAETAKKLKRRYCTVKNAATEAGLDIKRGRPREKALVSRNDRIRVLRGKKLLLRQIAERFNIGRERVRQILSETGGDPAGSDAAKAWAAEALNPTLRSE
jgi:hypothetical protein